MNVDSIDQIMLIRLNILPPYTYDDDEGERDKDEYIEFYQNKGEDCLESIEEYIAALNNFSDHRESDDAFSRLLDARAKFIKHFPFAYDELKNEETSSIDGFFVQMKNIYNEDLNSDFLINKLCEYRDAVSSIENF
jgi:hypothetical protein